MSEGGFKTTPYIRPLRTPRALCRGYRSDRVSDLVTYGNPACCRTKYSLAYVIADEGGNEIDPVQRLPELVRTMLA